MIVDRMGPNPGLISPRYKTLCESFLENAFLPCTFCSCHDIGGITPLRDSCLASWCVYFFSTGKGVIILGLLVLALKEDSTSRSMYLYRYVLSKVPLRTCPRDIPSEILSPMPEYLVRQYVRHRIKFFHCLHLRPPSGCHRHSAHHQQCTSIQNHRDICTHPAMVFSISRIPLCLAYIACDR